MENKLSHETLDLFVKLQPKIREVMGRWEIGDTCYDIGLSLCGIIIGIDSVESQPAYRVSSEDGGNRWYRVDGLLQIPPPINTFSTGYRDLWGMVDWTKFSENKKILNHGSLLLSFGNQDYIKGEPTLALLKAICQQKGV